MLGKTISHYRILEKLGKGGSGEVFRAHDERLDRDVALKILARVQNKESASVDRFIREARAASALNHPNIVTIHDAGQAKAGRFIVMELVQGRTLRAVMGTRMSLEGFVHVATQMVKALVAAHGAGIVHRDLKPENIMVRDDGYVKVLDFGLARREVPFKEGAKTVKVTTVVGTVLGTWRYMSPEQARGEVARSSSDIFSLGVVFYELLAGVHPFEARTPMAVLQAICSEPAELLSQHNPSVPYGLEAIVMRMVEKDHHLRPTALEVERVLEGFHQGSEILGLARSRRRIVGRRRELQELRSCSLTVLQGTGLLVVVGGEAGIGKTVLVEDFLEELKVSRKNWAIGRGRSSERLAGTEAHLPFLETLEDLLRADNDGSFSRLMRELAPNWHRQVSPPTVTSDGTAPLVSELKSASREVLKRELVFFLKAASDLRPLLLFFDDLHWADASTIDLLAYISTKFDTLRLLIIATYRPEEIVRNKHPFALMKLDLHARRRCRDVELGFLDREDVQNYLGLEFPGNHFPAVFTDLIYSKTEGNPFFMVDLLRYLRDRSVITHSSEGWLLAEALPGIDRDLPESIRGVIERKITLLPDSDKTLLAVASIQGHEFDSAVIAGILQLEPAEIEERLDPLDRMHGLVRLVREHEFPDRTFTLRYRFVHVLYQNAFYDSVKPTRRALWSAAVAQTLLHFHKDEGAEIASELAVLFEAARKFSEAADYFLIAARNATKAFAYSEAVILARRGLSILSTLPKTPERAQRELTMQLTLGVPLLAAKGYGNPEVEQSYDRARELSIEVGEDPRLFPALWGLATYYVARMELPTARELGEQLLRLAESSQDPAQLLGAHLSLGAAKYFSGEFVSSLEHFEQYRKLDDPQQRVALTRRYGLEPGILLRGFAARTLWFLGYPDRCVAELCETLKEGRALGDPPTLAFLLAMLALAHQMRGEVDLCHKTALELIKYSTDHGLSLWLAEGGFLAAWVVADRGNIEEGIREMRRNLADYSATGTVYHYFRALLAQILGKNGRIDEAWQVLTEVTRFDYPIYWDAGLRCVEGDILLISAAGETGESRNARISEAESKIREAMQLAQQQAAKSLELRATISLSKVYELQGRAEEGRQILAEIYSWFAEGFDTLDLRDARRRLGDSPETAFRRQQ